MADRSRTPLVQLLQLISSRGKDGLNVRPGTYERKQWDVTLWVSLSIRRMGIIKLISEVGVILWMRLEHGSFNILVVVSHLDQKVYLVHCGRN